MLLKMRRNRSTYSLLMGTQNGTAPLEDSLVASYKTKQYPIQQCVHWCLPKAFENFVKKPALKYF